MVVYDYLYAAYRFHLGLKFDTFALVLSSILFLNLVCDSTCLLLFYSFHHLFPYFSLLVGTISPNWSIIIKTSEKERVREGENNR